MHEPKRKKPRSCNECLEKDPLFDFHTHTIPLNEEFISLNQTKDIPAMIVAVAIKPIRAGPYLGTRNPSSGTTVLTSDIADNMLAKSTEVVCNCSERDSLSGPTR